MQSPLFTMDITGGNGNNSNTSMMFRGQQYANAQASQDNSHSAFSYSYADPQQQMYAAYPNQPLQQTTQQHAQTGAYTIAGNVNSNTSRSFQGASANSSTGVGGMAGGKGGVSYFSQAPPPPPPPSQQQPVPFPYGYGPQADEQSGMDVGAYNLQGGRHGGSGFAQPAMHMGNPYAAQQHPRQQRQHPQSFLAPGAPDTYRFSSHQQPSSHMGYNRRGGMNGRSYGGAIGGRQVHNSYFYNQQHHCSCNNAVPEKTPTLQLYNPATKKMMSIKLNRIYSTMADLRAQLQQAQTGKEKRSESDTTADGVDATEKATGGAADNTSTSDTATTPTAATTGDTAVRTPPSRSASKLVLCLDFLSPRGCQHGSGCDKVHAAGLEYMWEPITATTEQRSVTTQRKSANGDSESVTTDETMYAKGFTVHCYDPTLTKYYNILSEDLIVTDGAARYIAMYNEHGENFKEKFKLCGKLIESGSCDLGEHCTDIHCALSNFSHLEENHAQKTHVYSEEAMKDVPRLASTVQVRVFEQNNTEVFRDYTGNYVLVTEGAKTYMKYYTQENDNIPLRKRMQHCAHFRLKEMCRLGEGCRFLHVLPTPEEVQQRELREAEEAKNARAEREAAADAADASAAVETAAD